MVKKQAKNDLKKTAKKAGNLGVSEYAICGNKFLTKFPTKLTTRFLPN